MEEQQNIPNYLWQSIVVTILCCLPLGIPAIIFATQVNGKIQAGDIEGAMDASKKAKLFTWLSFGIGLAVIIVYAIINGLVIAAAIAEGGY